MVSENREKEEKIRTAIQSYVLQTGTGGKSAARLFLAHFEE